jgi:hypothetical protein
MNRTQKQERCKSAEHLAECIPPGPETGIPPLGTPPLTILVDPIIDDEAAANVVVDIVSSRTMTELRRDG